MRCGVTATVESRFSRLYPSPSPLFDYISAGHSTHCACHHWRPNLPGGCCICLEQSAGVSTRIAVTAGFSQQTEVRAFCPVVQLLWLRASHCTDYHVTSLLFLRVTCPCSLRTYATLKFIRSSSSSSSSSSPVANMVRWAYSEIESYLAN